MNMVDSFNACEAAKRFYDVNGYPSNAHVIAARTCGNDFFGVFLACCLGLFVLYKLQVKYDKRFLK